MNEENIIEINQLRTEIGSLLIHEQINLKVQRREILGIIGGSGTGKTTLLREMLLLKKPTAGTIKIFGQDIFQLTAKQTKALRRRCGVMFQQGALFSSLTVAENIALPLREQIKNLTQRFIEEIIAFKLALVGLPPHTANKYPNQLSGGMIKRVAVARALALDAEILFLDEPTAGLDPIGANALDELILRLKETLGLTIVMITHDLATLRQVTDRIAVLADKQILAVAPMHEILQLNHPWLQEYFQGTR
jgi:phospholipid/cholesterol/gamma-HCH transport system ATP-binding protein